MKNMMNKYNFKYYVYKKNVLTVRGDNETNNAKNGIFNSIDIHCAHYRVGREKSPQLKRGLFLFQIWSQNKLTKFIPRLWFRHFVSKLFQM